MWHRRQSLTMARSTARTSHDFSLAIHIRARSPGRLVRAISQASSHAVDHAPIVVEYGLPVRTGCQRKYRQIAEEFTLVGP